MTNNRVTALPHTYQSGHYTISHYNTLLYHTFVRHHDTLPHLPSVVAPLAAGWVAPLAAGWASPNTDAARTAYPHHNRTQHHIQTRTLGVSILR